jgi:acetyl esterase/lipase
MLALVVLAAACSGDSEPTTVPDTTLAFAATTTTLAPSTTAPATTAAATTTTIAVTTTAEGPAFTETSDLVYMTVGGADLLIDVYTPAGDGPWPVAVLFHGLDSALKDGPDTTLIAEEAAAEGLMVFTPSWLALPFDFNLATYQSWVRVANCALAFAQHDAAARGGDPTNTVVHGFSGGIGPSLIASTQQIADPIPGCSTDEPPTPVAGVVLGDGTYFLHDPNFDPVFDSDLVAMQAEVAKLIDPTTWPSDVDAEFFLWIPESDTVPRVVDDAWLDQRDPDGSIRADLDQLGQLDDSSISNRDNAFLLEFRLAAAGFTVTLDEYPGGHTTADKVPDLVGYLKTATS